MALHYDEVIKIITDNLGKDLISSEVRERYDGCFNRQIQRSIYLKVNTDVLHKTVLILREMSILHISCPMATKEHEWGLEMLYIFTLFPGEGGFKEIPVIISVDLPADNLKIRSLTDIVPGILIMEREAQEMLGIVVEDIPDKRHFFTPDNMEKGYFPLRNKVEPVDQGGRKDE